MYKLYKLYLPLLLSAILVGTTACKDDDEPTIKKQQVTTINLQLNAEGKGKTDVTTTFKDLSGVAGKTATSPVILEANTTYTGAILLQDESVSPVKDVTSMFSTAYNVSNADVAVTENSGTLTFKAGAATTGTNGQLRITLTENGQSSLVTFPLMVR